NQIAMFCDYLADARYGWAEQCVEYFGTHPSQICHEDNMPSHSSPYEGRPEVRALTRRELQDFFDYADEQVLRARASGRKGWLPAFRDASLFKVIYGWGLRRREAGNLDLADFSRNPKAPEFRALRCVLCEVREGGEGVVAAEADGVDGLGLVGRGRRRVRGRGPAAVRGREAAAAVALRARGADHRTAHHPTVRRVPGHARAGGGAASALPAALLHHSSDRGRR